MDSLISSKKVAIALRKKGKSYNEINKILGTPKSTLSFWLKNLPISSDITKCNISKAKKIWAKNIINYNKKRSLEYNQKKKLLLEKFSKEIPAIDNQALFWIGLSLFWAEGGKREEWSVRFVNSDSEMIKLIMRFFREICKVSNDKFRFRIYLHPNITEEQAIRYWSYVTRVSKQQFYKSQNILSKSSKLKRKFNHLPYGTLHIYIGDALFAKKMKGWLRGLISKI